MERKHTDFPLYRESFEHDACGIGAESCSTAPARTPAARPATASA